MSKDFGNRLSSRVDFFKDVLSMELLFKVNKGSYVIIAFVLSVIHVLSSVHVVAFGNVSNACMEMIGLASFVKNITVKKKIMKKKIVIKMSMRMDQQ